MERQPRVRLTPHCQRRLTDRNITEEQVRDVVLNPESVFEDNEHGEIVGFEILNSAKNTTFELSEVIARTQSIKVTA